MTAVQCLPRFIRLRDAPGYLGMDRNRFNAEVRPALIEIPIGSQGIAFDRLDLDGWAEQYKSRNGRPAFEKGVTKSWDASEPLDSARSGTSGTSRSASEAVERFEKVLRQTSSKKPNVTSFDG